MPVHVPTRVVGGDATDFVEVYTTGEIDAAFGERDARIGNLEADAGDLRKDLRNAEARISSHDGSIGELYALVRDLDAALGGRAAAADVTSLGVQLSSLVGSVSELYARVAQLENWRRDVAPVIDVISPDWVIRTIQENLAPLQQAVQNAVRDVQQQAAAATAALAQAQATLERQVADTVAAILQDMQARFASFSGTISTLERTATDALVAARGARDAAEEIGKTVRTELDQRLERHAQDFRKELAEVAARIPRLRRFGFWETMMAEERDEDITVVDIE